ncbi:MAG: thiamine diphosphokinase [Tepidiformaceae bacterium]
MRALVIANGDAPSTALLQELAAAAQLVIAADGGLRHALAAGIHVHAVVGDLDSVTPEMRRQLPAERFHQRSDADTTDLQKAIVYATEQGATEVDVVAAAGGRADHALANLSVLRLFRGRAAVRIVDNLFEISLVEGEATVDAPAGTVISLVAIGQAEGVTTTGLRWNLAAAALAFGPHGIHNEIAEPPARIVVTSGDLLLFRGRWVEKHA